MKRTHIFTTLVILLLCILNSCQSTLDVMPDGRKNLDAIFSDEATAAAYLNGCYQDFPKYALHNYFWTNTRILQTDDAWEFGTTPTMANVRLYTGSITPTVTQNVLIKDAATGLDYFTINKWDMFWRNIRRCNIFMEYIEKTPLTDEENRERWIAEATVLRSYYFMEMITCFGGLPILKSSLPLDHDYSSLRRNSFYDCAQSIIGDCKKVIEESDLPWRREVQSENGRMTKAVAAVLVSRAALYMASPLWNEGKDHWATAEQLTKEMLDLVLNNGYEMYTELRNAALFKNNVYHEYFCTPRDYSSDPFDKESILVSRSPNNTWPNVAGMPLQNAHKAGLCPTQELVDAYCMAETGLSVLDLAKPYLDSRHLEPNYNDFSETGYDPENPYAGRDPRFYATVHHNDSQRKNTAGKMVNVQTFDGGNCGIQTNNNKRTPSGYYTKKYDHPNAVKPTLPNTKYPLMRLAELYLNYAEAAAENGNVSGAIAGVHPVRNRVGMPDIAPGDAQEAILMVRNERRVEMAFEENRYYDIRRWTSPDGNLEELTGYLSGMWITKDSNNPLKYTYRRFNIGDSYDKNSDTWSGTATHRACAANKYLLWPIETTEVNRLETATGMRWQNPGW